MIQRKLLSACASGSLTHPRALPTYLPHRQSSLVSCCGSAMGDGPVSHSRAKTCTRLRLVSLLLISTGWHWGSSRPRTATPPAPMRFGGQQQYWRHCMWGLPTRRGRHLRAYNITSSLYALPPRAETYSEESAGFFDSRAWGWKALCIKDMAAAAAAGVPDRRRSFRRRTRACIRRFSSPR